MTYHQRNRSLVVAIILFVFFILARFLFASFFSSLFTSLARPLWKSRTGALHIVNETVPTVEPRSSLVSKLNNLEQQVSDLQAKNLELQTQVDTLSNNNLQALLQSPGTLVIANVLSRPPYTPFDSLIIDKGTDAGIAAGQTVYSSAGVALGTVASTLGSSAQVFLYSSGGTATQAIIARSGETVSLRGLGGGNFDIVVPKDFNVQVGDTLTDSSPARSLIAQVYAVDSTSSDSFKKVQARLPNNALQLQWVGVDLGK